MEEVLAALRDRPARSVGHGRRATAKQVACGGIFSREDFKFDKERNLYICPAGKSLTTTGRLVNDGETLLYMAGMRHCRRCPLKAHCCPKAPFRRVPRSIYEEARDVARALAKTEAFDRRQ